MNYKRDLYFNLQIKRVFCWEFQQEDKMSVEWLQADCIKNIKILTSANAGITLMVTEGRYETLKDARGLLSKEL
jgi:hypothetical protein